MVLLIVLLIAFLIVLLNLKAKHIAKLRFNYICMVDRYRWDTIHVSPIFGGTPLSEHLVVTAKGSKLLGIFRRRNIIPYHISSYPLG